MNAMNATFSPALSAGPFEFIAVAAIEGEAERLRAEFTGLAQRQDGLTDVESEEFEALGRALARAKAQLAALPCCSQRVAQAKCAVIAAAGEIGLAEAEAGELAAELRRWIAGPEAATCPVELIGREAAQIYSMLDQIDARRGPFADLPSLEREALEGQAWDRIDALDRQAEWARPESLAGVYYQVLRLRELMEEVADAPSGRETGRPLRRFARLHSAALDGLERLAGLDGTALGRSGQLQAAGPAFLSAASAPAAAA